MTIARQTGDIARGSRLRDRLEEADHVAEDPSRYQGPCPAHLLPGRSEPALPRDYSVEASVLGERSPPALIRNHQESSGISKAQRQPVAGKLRRPDESPARERQRHLDRERKARYRARQRGEAVPVLPPGRPSHEPRALCPACRTVGRSRGVRRGVRRWRCLECKTNWQEGTAESAPGAAPVETATAAPVPIPGSAAEEPAAAPRWQCANCLATADRPTLTCPRCGEARMVDTARDERKVRAKRQQEPLDDLVSEEDRAAIERITVEAREAARKIVQESPIDRAQELAELREQAAVTGELPCTRCGKVKPVEEFSRCSGAPKRGYRHWWCRTCFGRNDGRGVGTAYSRQERNAFSAGYYQVFEDLGWNVGDLRCRCGKLEREHFGGALGECSGFRVARRIG